MDQSTPQPHNGTLSEIQALALVGLPVQNGNRAKLRKNVKHTFEVVAGIRVRRYLPADCHAFAAALKSFVSPHPPGTVSESHACRLLGLSINKQNRLKVRENVPSSIGLHEGINVRRYLLTEVEEYARRRADAGEQVRRYCRRSK